MSRKQRMRELGIIESLFKVTKIVRQVDDQVSEVELTNSRKHFQIEKS